LLANEDNLKYNTAMFTAYYCCGEETYKSGFITPEKAWDWVGKNGLCDSCKESLKLGYAVYHDENEVEHRLEVTHPEDTSCGAEWSVIPTSEFEPEAKYEEDE